MITDECWLYAGIIHTDGYGLIQAKIAGKWKLLRAHRVVYENMVGEIPPELVSDHICRVRSCINPEHIELVSNALNVARGHTRLTHCINGHEFTKANTMLHKNGRWRRCRTCVNKQTREYYHRRSDNQ